MTADDLDAILDEIDALAGVPEMQPDDVTVDVLMDRWHIGRCAAGDRMVKLVAKGLFVKLRVMNPVTRRIVNVWRKR